MNFENIAEFQNINLLWKEIFLRSIQLSWNEAWNNILGQKKEKQEKAQAFLLKVVDIEIFNKETKQRLEKEFVLDMFQLTKFHNPPSVLIDLFFKFLKNIEKISCEYSKITDLQALQYCQALRILLLGDSKISDLKGIEHLKNLEEIRFSYTQIHDLNPLIPLKNLKIIYAIHSKITDIEPLKNLPNLEELYIGLTSVNSITPLNDLPKLKIINHIGAKIK